MMKDHLSGQRWHHCYHKNDSNGATFELDYNLPEEMSGLKPHQLIYIGGKLSPQPGDTFISITQLENSTEKTPRNAVLLCMVLCYKLAEKNLDDRPKMFNRQSKSIVYNYERMLKLRCLNSAEGVNVFSILMSKQRNSHIFDFYQEKRDEGLFRPGAIIAIHRPIKVVSWLGHGNEPLLDVPSSFYCVDRSCVCVPEASINHNAPRTHSFHYKNAKLDMINIDCIDCHCKGSLCSALDLYKDGLVLNVCPCFNCTKRTSGITFLCSFKFCVQDSTGQDLSFDVDSFTSSEFMKCFILDGHVPAGITASMITENELAYRYFIDKVFDAIEAVNDSTGFEVDGWVRKGYTVDQALKEASKVRSSDSILHVTYLNFERSLVDKYKTDLISFLSNETLTVGNQKNSTKEEQDKGVEEDDSKEEQDKGVEEDDGVL